MRLGDLDALKEEFKRIYRCAETAEQLANNMEDAIDNAPTVESEDNAIQYTKGYQDGFLEGKKLAERTTCGGPTK